MDELCDTFSEPFAVPSTHTDEFEIKIFISLHICKVQWKNTIVVVKRAPVEDSKHTARLMQSMAHPHIMRMFEMRQDVSFGYMIMEDVGKSSLTETLANPIPHPLFVAIQLTSACRHMHERFIRHGSISTDTVIVSGPLHQLNIKLISFGLASFTGFCNFKVKKQMDINTFTAPEIIATSQAMCTEDIWSMGLVLFAVLFNKPPHIWVPDINQFVAVHLTQDTPAFTSIIRGCLRAQAKQRFSAAMLHNMIEELMPPGTQQPMITQSAIDTLLWEQPNAAAQLLVSCTDNTAAMLPCFDAMLSHVVTRWDWGSPDSLTLLKVFSLLFSQSDFFTDQPAILIDQLTTAGGNCPGMVTALWALLMQHHKVFAELIRAQGEPSVRIAYLGACEAIETGMSIDPAIAVLQSIETDHPVAKLLILIRSNLFQAQTIIQQANTNTETAIKRQQFLSAQLAAIRVVCDNATQHQQQHPPPPPS